MTAYTNRARWGALGAVALLAVGVGSASAQETTLRMVGSFPIGPSRTAEIGNQFMERVNELGEGKVQINYVGASDVIPTFDQPQALVNGVFDIWYGAPNYWAGIVPGGDVTELSPYRIPDQGPGSDLYQFMVDLYADKGVRYIGHATGDVGVGTHYLSTNFEVDSLDDLDGAQLRVAPLMRHFVQAVGAEPITLPPADIFLAIDRGTVDGFTWPVADAYTQNGWQDVTDYLIDQPMYRSGGSVAMNMQSWDNLSPEVQDIMLEAMTDVQEWAVDYFASTQAEEIEAMTAAGMEVVALPENVSEEWTKIARQSLWDYYKDAMTEEHISEVKSLLELDLD